ncbi:sulfatase [Paenibacillus sp. GCM10027626]|uniref:sulfatase family protein n=1 Tax=Paenibacillus sp. GCM10027626 TaxID=3273411 RepID=UPI00362DE66E
MKQPNILFIMSDDHASHAISSYGSVINHTPNIDRIAEGGIRFDNCFCTNSICAPSRATILTGVYNHINGVKTLDDHLDGTMMNFPKLLQQAGYETAIIGKWHLGHGGNSDPTGFHYWNVLPDQGDYFDPEFIEMGKTKRINGYVTDIITAMSIDWIKKRDKNKPFMLMCHHKAPHRSWLPSPKYADLYKDADIPEPPTFHDDYSTRAEAARAARMRIGRDLLKKDVKGEPPQNSSPGQIKSWNYQRYIKDYLRCVASIDESVGLLLDTLQDEEIWNNTIVVYTSDQGFFLGDHGWFDKRFMYEESLRMPLLIQYPQEIKAGSVSRDMVLNVDFAATFLEAAGVAVPEEMQGRSMRPVWSGHTPPDWRTSMYYRYWMHLDKEHSVYSHYGIRTHDYKLIYYYADALGTTGSLDERKPAEWELFDLKKDPCEMNNVYGAAEYASVIALLKQELLALQLAVKDVPYETDEGERFA